MGVQSRRTPTSCDAPMLSNNPTRLTIAVGAPALDAALSMYVRLSGVYERSAEVM